MDNKPFYIILGLTVVAIGIGAFAYNFMGINTSTAGISNEAIDTFAKCLTSKGATFYGAFWCPHCQDEKHLFGDAMKDIHYVECSTPDGREQTQACKDAGIRGYPTWKFAEGDPVEGVQSFQALSERTGCPVPAGTEPAPAAPAAEAQPSTGATASSSAGTADAGATAAPATTSAAQSDVSSTSATPVAQ